MRVAKSGARYDEAEDDRQHELLALSEKVLQLVTMMEPYLTTGGHDDVVTPIAETIGSMVHSLECFERTTEFVGDLLFEYQKVQLHFLLSHSFTVTQISKMFGCHRRTIHRRIHEYEISVHNISDNVLDDFVQSMCTLHRRSGGKSIEGKLRSIGLKIQRERIRESLHRVALKVAFEECCIVDSTVSRVQMLYGT